MRRFFALCSVMLKRIMMSRAFLCSCVGLACLYLLSVYQEIKGLDGNIVSILYLYEIASHANFWVLYLLFAAIPGGSLFCIDWEQRYIRSLILRSSKRIYGAASSIACFISSLLTVLLGEWIFVLILRVRFPFILAGDVSTLGMGDTVYRSLLTENQVLIYFMVRILIKAFCAAFFSVFAIWLSTKITNIFVTLTSPIILYYLVENLGVLLQLPSWLQIATIAKGHFMVGDSLQWTLLYPIILFSILGLVITMSYISNVKGRVENG